MLTGDDRAEPLWAPYMGDGTDTGDTSGTPSGKQPPVSIPSCWFDGRLGGYCRNPGGFLVFDSTRRWRCGPLADTGSITTSCERILGSRAGPWWCRGGDSPPGLVVGVTADQGEESLEYIDESEACRLWPVPSSSPSGTRGGVLGR